MEMWNEWQSDDVVDIVVDGSTNLTECEDLDILSGMILRHPRPKAKRFKVLSEPDAKVHRIRLWLDMHGDREFTDTFFGEVPVSKIRILNNPIEGVDLRIIECECGTQHITSEHRYPPNTITVRRVSESYLDESLGIVNHKEWFEIGTQRFDSEIKVMRAAETILSQRRQKQGR